MLNHVHERALLHWFWACFILLSAFVASTAQADSAISVRAVVDQTRLAPGESLQLSVTINNGQGDVDVDNLSGFKVFSRGTSSSVQIINGQTSREESHNFLLIPQRTGQLTIPALAVNVDGRTFKTDPITITVTKRSSGAQSSSDQEVWVEATVSTDQPYVGQQVTYTFSVYQSVQLTDASIDKPDFKGFTAIEVKERGSQHKVINGREIGVTRFYFVLVPLSPGNLEIEPAVLRAGIVRPATRRRRSPFDDFFNDPFFRQNQVENKVFQSQALTVNVQPLPPLSDKTPFSGLVGQFTLKSDVENQQLKVGDSTTLSITLEGQGNLLDAAAPTLELPAALKTYADTPEEKVTLSAVGYRGKKVFRTALVPVQAGNVALPSVRITYFDTAQKAYRTLSAALPTLQVAPSDQASLGPLSVTPGNTASAKKEVAFTGRDILPLKEGLETLQSERPMAWPLFLIWVVVPALGFGGLVMVQRLRRQELSPAARMRAKAQQAVKSAATAREAQDLQAFLTPLYQAVTAAIFYKAGRSGEALTWREAEQLLTNAGVEDELVQQAVHQLTRIESSKFSGSTLTAEQRSTLLESTQHVVKRLTQ